MRLYRTPVGVILGAGTQSALANALALMLSGFR